MSLAEHFFCGTYIKNIIDNADETGYSGPGNNTEKPPHHYPAGRFCPRTR